MFLSKQKNGFYYLFYFKDNTRFKISTKCNTKTDAYKFLTNFKIDSIKKIKEIRISKLLEEFLNNNSRNYSISTIKHFQVAVREFIRIEGDVFISKLSPITIEHFLRIKITEASSWSARKYFTALASMFETAFVWQLLIKNPFRDVDKPKTIEIQQTYLTANDLDKILNSTTDFLLKNLITFATLTGLRLNEILNLEWTDIDLENDLIYLTNKKKFITKNKRIRIIPICTFLKNILYKMEKQKNCNIVFNRNQMKLNDNYISKKFKKIVRICKLDERIHFHSLRHTFASWLVQKGVSIYEVQKLLGHSNISVTQMYAHLIPNQMHNSVNKLNENFAFN